MNDTAVLDHGTIWLGIATGSQWGPVLFTKYGESKMAADRQGVVVGKVLSLHPAGCHSKKKERPL